MTSKGPFKGRLPSDAPVCEPLENWMTIKIVIADDHEVVRAGLRAIFNETEIKIVGEAASGDSVVKLVEKHSPHIVLLDVQMPEGDGLTALNRIRLEKPELPVLMFSAFDNSASLARAVALGANGYLSKSANRRTILDAIRRVATGESIWTREELRRVTGALAAPRSALQSTVPLTTRESQVLAQLATGATNKEIALELDISYETIKEHVQHVLRKIGVTDRTQAAVWAVRNGVL